jgi:hypothetical protein
MQARWGHGAYTIFRSETRLSPEDIETICAAAKQLNPGISASR